MIGQKTQIDNVLRACRLNGEQWMGVGQSFSTMIGFTGTNEMWQKIVTAGELGECFKVTQIFIYNPSQDDITRVQIAIGVDAVTKYMEGNYTEVMVKFNGTNYKCQEITCPLCKDQHLWIRPIVDNNPGKDATVNFFVCIQRHD